MAIGDDPLAGVFKPMKQKIIFSGTTGVDMPFAAGSLASPSITQKIQPNPLDFLKQKEPTVSHKIVEEQAPDNPGLREVRVSTYGINVPVSIGRRVVTGNVIDAEPLEPRLVGAYEYTTEIRRPVYESPGPS